MPTSLTIKLLNRPGTLAEATEALGRAGAQLEGGCGYVCEEGTGVFHVLAADVEQARHALIDAGFEIEDERQVVVVQVSDEPGAVARILRRVGDAGVNIDLLYMATGSRLVLAGSDPHALAEAVR